MVAQPTARCIKQALWYSRWYNTRHECAAAVNPQMTTSQSRCSDTNNTCYALQVITDTSKTTQARSVSCTYSSYTVTLGKETDVLDSGIQGMDTAGWCARMLVSLHMVPQRMLFQMSQTAETTPSCRVLRYKTMAAALDSGLEAPEVSVVLP